MTELSEAAKLLGLLSGLPYAEADSERSKRSDGPSTCNNQQAANPDESSLRQAIQRDSPFALPRLHKCWA